MNLHGIVAGAVGAVNPQITIQAKASNGYTKDAAFNPIPAYANPVNILAQVQPLQFDDLKQLDSLNIQGVRRAVFLPGSWNAVVRSDKQGGDLLIFPDRPGGQDRTWLVAFVFESWPAWSKVAVTLQNDQHA